MLSTVYVGTVSSKGVVKRGPQVFFPRSNRREWIKRTEIQNITPAGKLKYHRSNTTEYIEKNNYKIIEINWRQDTAIHYEVVIIK